MPTAQDQMMLGAVQLIFQRLRARGDEAVLWEQGQEISANHLLAQTSLVVRRLQSSNIGAGCIVGFCGDYGLATVSTFLALFEIKAIAVPISIGAKAELSTLAAEAQMEFWLDMETLQVSSMRAQPAGHPLVLGLRETDNPGLIVFTSGSSGRPKAILHDVERVASKFVTLRQGWRMVLFLLIDHFGGFNTLLACLAYGGTGVCVNSRKPSDVCAAIASAHAELLPTTPTFLSVLIASGAWRKNDLSSIKLITYGAEPMPERVLKQLPMMFPTANFKQTYGLSELGVLQSVSPEKGSLWLRVGGQDFETKVVDGILHIKSRSSMLGYLNAESPIDEDGWMNTGDMVEEEGDLIKVTGRQSDVINVGGQKVFPAEVEAVLLECPQVAEATVYAISHPMLGQVVGAKLSLLIDTDDGSGVLAIIKAHCKSHLQRYKIPMRFELVGLDQHGSERGKKVRR